MNTQSISRAKNFSIIAFSALLASCGGGSESVSPHIQPGGEFSIPATQTTVTSGRRASIVDLPNLIVNGGFESGSAPWISSGNVIRTNESLALKGESLAVLGGTNAKDFLQQDFQIPGNAVQASLQFGIGIATDEAAGAGSVDYLRVDILDAKDGTWLGLLGNYSNAGANEQWMQSPALDLLKFKGKQVRLLYSVITDSSAPTWFLIDEAKISVRIDDVLTLKDYRENYDVSHNPNGQLSVKTKGTSVVVAQSQFSRIIFKDGVVVYATTDMPARIYRLYQAAFNRSPDPAGLGHWITLNDNGGVTLDQTADYFMDSKEFKDLYGTLTNSEFVTQLYENVLHRAPDPGGHAFHLNNLDRGNVNRAALLMSFSDSAENVAQVYPRIKDGFVYTTATAAPPTCLPTHMWKGAACIEKPPTPTIVSVTPTGKMRAGYFTLIVKFFGYMDPASVQDSLALTRKGGSKELIALIPDHRSTLNGYSTTFYASLTFPENSSYSATISGNVRNKEGLILGADHNWTFETGCEARRVYQNGQCVPFSALVCPSPKVAYEGECVDSLPSIPPLTCTAPKIPSNGVCVDPVNVPISGSVILEHFEFGRFVENNNATYKFARLFGRPQVTSFYPVLVNELGKKLNFYVCFTSSNLKGMDMRIYAARLDWLNCKTALNIENHQRFEVGTDYPYSDGIIQVLVTDPDKPADQQSIIVGEFNARDYGFIPTPKPEDPCAGPTSVRDQKCTMFTQPTPVKPISPTAPPTSGPANPGGLPTALACVSTSRSNGSSYDTVTITNNCGRDVFYFYCGDLEHSKRTCGSNNNYFTHSNNLKVSGSGSLYVKKGGSYRFGACYGGIGFSNEGNFAGYANGTFACLKQ